VSVPDKPVITPGPFTFPNDRDTLADGAGNKAIALKNCHNVIFRDFLHFPRRHFAILRDRGRQLDLR